MAKLVASTFDSMTVYGTLLPILGGGFATTAWPLQVAAATGTWYFPAELQVPGAKFKATMVGGGSSGASSPALAGYKGNGGTSGSVAIAIISVIENVYSLTYTVGSGGVGAGGLGSAGTASSIVYNALTYTVAGGPTGANPGTLPTSPGGAQTLYFLGFAGNQGASGGSFATAGPNLPSCFGGDTPMGWGTAGRDGSGAASHVGVAGRGFGSGGSGGSNASSAVANVGGNGAGGLILIEW